MIFDINTQSEVSYKETKIQVVQGLKCHWIFFLYFFCSSYFFNWMIVNILIFEQYCSFLNIREQNIVSMLLSKVINKFPHLLSSYEITRLHNYLKIPSGIKLFFFSYSFVSLPHLFFFFLLIIETAAAWFHLIQ